jgi:YD repeat-containing protein
LGSSNSGSIQRRIGSYWYDTYQRQVHYTSGNLLIPDVATVTRQDGRLIQFSLSQGAWISESDTNERLIELKDAGGNTTGWTLNNAADNSIESYDADGKLISITNRTGQTQTLTYSIETTASNIAPTLGLLIRVTDAFGRQLNFTYDALSRIKTMTDPSGGVYQYSYDTVGNLKTVTYPNNKIRTYVYNEQANTSNTDLPYALTGIIDENGDRFATYKYDAQGRAISTEHAGGAERTTLTYNTDGTTSVTDARNTTRTYSFQTVLGVVKNTGISEPCPTCGGSASNLTYDANGNVATKTDFNGNVTNYIYDLTRNLETSRTEGVGSPEARTITTQWHADFRLPTRIAEPLRITTLTYHGDGGVTCGATGRAVPQDRPSHHRRQR